jgi:hypothetical protein
MKLAKYCSYNYEYDNQSEMILFLLLVGHAL